MAMVTTEQQTPGGASVAQRWQARLALVAAAAAVLVAPLVAGFGKGLALVLVGLAGLSLSLAGVWWALTHKGLVRWLASAVAVAAPLVVLVLTPAEGCCGSCWWRSGCWWWPSPPAGPRYVATPPPSRCANTTPPRPGDRT